MRNFTICVSALVKRYPGGLCDQHAPSCQLVRAAMTSIFEDGDFNLPKPKNLARNIQRARQKVRPADPTDLEFVVIIYFLSFRITRVEYLIHFLSITNRSPLCKFVLIYLVDTL